MGGRRIAFADASSRLNAYASPVGDSFAKPVGHATPGGKSTGRKKWGDAIHHIPNHERIGCSPVVQRHLGRDLDETARGVDRR